MPHRVYNLFARQIHSCTNAVSWNSGKECKKHTARFLFNWPFFRSYHRFPSWEPV